MVGTIGLNVNGQGISADIVTSYVQQLKPRTCLVMNEGKLAALLQPTVPRVIYRMKSNEGILDDDAAHLKHDPKAFAQALNALAPPGCWVYGGNEPNSSSLVTLNDWTLRFVEECTRLNRRPVVYNFPYYHPEQGTAAWRLLKPSAMAAIQAGGAIGIHIYFNRTINASLGAFQVLHDLRSVLGDVPVVVTEYGCAADNDARRGFNGAISEEQYGAELGAGVLQHSDDNTDWLIFIYGIWAEGRSYEITHAETTKHLLAQFNQEHPVTQTPPNWQRRFAQPTNPDFPVNVRAGQTTGAAVVAQIPKTGAVIELDINWLRPPDIPPANWWWSVRYNGRTGYVRTDTLDEARLLEELPDTAPPFDLPVPFPSLDPTPEEAEQIAQNLEWFANAPLPMGNTPTYLLWLAQVIRQRGAVQT